MTEVRAKAPEQATLPVQARGQERAAPPPTLVVVPDDPTPPFEQLRRQLAELVSAGVLGPGARLPPVRQLAGDLGLAVGTVARAYRELESAGLVRSRRGGGTRVADGVAARSEGERRRLLAEHAAAFARQARLLGVDDAEALRAAAAALGSREA